MNLAASSFWTLTALESLRNCRTNWLHSDIMSLNRVAAEILPPEAWASGTATFWNTPWRMVPALSRSMACFSECSSSDTVTRLSSM